MPNGYQNKQQDKKIEELERDKEKLKEDFYRHMSRFNGEMGDVRMTVGEIKTDVDWLKKTYWIVATSAVGALVVGLLNLLTKSEIK